jgi:uncharacterized protein YndB with AHSA1/START domain
MAVYTASVEIAAPPGEVWAVLTDLSVYPDWNPFTIDVVSQLVVGGEVDLHVRMWGGWLHLWQKEVVSAVEAPHRLGWGVRLLGGAVVGARMQTLEPLANGGTCYTTEDAITGPLAWMVELLFGGSLRTGFDGVAQGLRERCEGEHAGRPGGPC